MGLTKLKISLIQWENNREVEDQLWYDKYQCMALTDNSETITRSQRIQFQVQAIIMLIRVLPQDK